MRPITTTITTIAAIASLLAGCGNDPQPVYQAPAAPAIQQAAQAPIVVQAAPQHSGMQDMLTGAALGALATHALSGGGRSAAPAPTVNNTHTRIVERTVIVRQVPAKPSAPVPAAVMSPTAPRPAAATYSAPRTSYAPPARVVPTYKPAASRR